MTDIAELIKSWPAIAGAVVAVLAALIQSVKSLLEFHDAHLQNRVLKRLAFLAKECEDEPLKRLISTARNEEVFRTLFGKNASPEFVHGVTRLYESGKFSLSELRMISPYLKPVNDSVVVEIKKGDIILSWASLAVIVLMMLYTTAFVILLLSTPSISSLVAALVLVALFLLFVRFVRRDILAVFIAKRVKAKLAAMQNAT